MGDSDATARPEVLRRLGSILPTPARVKVVLRRVHDEFTAPEPERLNPGQPVAVPRSAVSRRREGRRVVPHTSTDVRALRSRILALRTRDENAERTAAIAAEFARAHPIDVERLASEFPEDVANLAGVPAAVRMTANRALIAKRFTLAQEHLATAERRLAAARDEVNGTAVRRPRLRDPLAPYVADVERATEAIAVLEQYRSVFVDHDGVEHARQFLTVVPSTRFSSGQVVEVFGDLTRASHVLVAVPGVANSYGNFQETRQKSEALYRTLAVDHPEASVAVIEWMGYDVPGWLRSPLPFAAINGGGELRRFVDALGLDAGVQLTVLGHSYGSVVVSEALRNGLEADRAIFTGSPGVRAPVAAALGIDPSRVFALAAERDIVVRLKWHGKNPADALFGATLLAVEGHGHGAYFAPESLSMHNIARVVLGKVDELVHAVRPAPTDPPTLALDR